MTNNVFLATELISGCSPPSTSPFPKGKSFAIQDVVCVTSKGAFPVPNPEVYLLTVFDGASRSGPVVLETTFASTEGLRYSPNLAVAVSENMTVQLLRASDENGGVRYVGCQFLGSFEKAP